MTGAQNEVVTRARSPQMDAGATAPAVQVAQ